MTREEMKAELRRLEAELEDLEETLAFNFINTSAHIGGGQVRKDEAALDELRTKIEEVRTRLGMV